eukprot:CAMPEP_0201726044 /NCGR_PEP_ID=MMETSP0593-20130828/9240_1 /ASSEMBLY_ACC=CAM_ASM_000672 /TAXON_ID=267983 /ORGANISM="Skeletonema japonicum, Strain CCMP2506" /LENGTH=318 /DNA_ID=CAMNT_0048217511 /DNA_START=115 /DNA_END=1071 /DNA_ORIENTATION=+
MKFITSLISITALASSALATKQTTVTILEFGKGGTIHTSANTIQNAAASITTTPAAMTSFWKAMHPTKDGKYSSHGYAGMSVVPDLFTKADLGVIVGLGGNVAGHLSEKNMPTAMSLLNNGGVGQVKISGHVANALVQGMSNTKKSAAAAVVVTDKDDFGRRLSTSTTANEAGSSLDAMSLQISNDIDAKEADDQLRQLIQRLKDEADSSDKTVVVHLVVETIVPDSVVAASSSRRRLDEEGDQNNNQEGDENQDGENGYTTYAYNYRTMYQIQTFNVITWTAVGLVVVVFMVMGSFIGMPLYPDTLLFGFSSKLGSD